MPINVTLDGVGQPFSVDPPCRPQDLKESWPEAGKLAGIELRPAPSSKSRKRARPVALPLGLAMPVIREGPKVAKVGYRIKCYGIDPAFAQRIAEYVLRDPVLKPLPDLSVSMLFEIREVVIQEDGILRPNRLPHLFWEVACSFLDRP